MSYQSIPPLPVQDPPEASVPAYQDAPDLSSLRQGWSTKFKDIPSFPEIDPATATTSEPSATAKKAPLIPTLPSLGAMANKDVLDMGGYTDLFGTPASKTPDRNTLDIPQIPETTLPTATPAAPENSSIKNLSAMPSMDAPNVSIPLVRDRLMAQASPPAERVKAPTAKTPPPSTSATPAPPSRTQPVQSEPAQTPEYAETDFTDQDLREALRPIIDPCVDKFLYTPSHGIHTYLEPMLRSTVRRAIAEQMGDASPFREVSGWDKFAWKMRALLGSRDYEDIVFDHTKRYQVEEVFLLRPRTRSLISYASHDPTRHIKPAKVHSTVRKIGSKINKEANENESCIKWENTRNLMIRRGEHSILAAIVHGPSNAILRADLDYALRQAEERFGKTLEEESDIHLQVLQPLLEGCLLIQAPAIPT